MLFVQKIDKIKDRRGIGAGGRGVFWRKDSNVCSLKAIWRRYRYICENVTISVVGRGTGMAMPVADRPQSTPVAQRHFPPSLFLGFSLHVFVFLFGFFFGRGGDKRGKVVGANLDPN